MIELPLSKPPSLTKVIEFSLSKSDSSYRVPSTINRLQRPSSSLWLVSSIETRFPCLLEQLPKASGVEGDALLSIVAIVTYHRSDMAWLQLQNRQQHSAGSRSVNTNTQNEELDCIGKARSMKHLCVIKKITTYAVYDISEQAPPGHVTLPTTGALVTAVCNGLP